MKSSLIFFILLLTANLAFAQTGTKLVPPALIEGFATITSAAGTTTLTRASETKQIVTGSTTQTVKLPDATTMSKELGRRFYIINKSSGNVTLVDAGSNTLATIAGATQVEAHLRAAGSANGTWDILASSGGGGGGTWGSITGTLSSQTDLQTALNLKAPLASPTFTGTITTPLTASRALVTGASSELAASAVTATQLGYLGTSTSDIQVQLDAKQARSTLTTAGDIYVATASATTTRLGPPAIDGRQLVSDSAATNKIRYKAPDVDNFIKNGDAESVTPISVYADAAGTRPVDCTGGSPNVTTSISSSSPLADVNSFTLVKDAANRQGQGWSIPFTIPASQQAKVLQIELPYIVSSGTFVAGTSTTDSDVIWYVYDVTNSTLIEPSSIKLLSNSTTISDKFIANFQTSATGTSYRLCAHVATTSASAYTLKTDDIIVKPSQYVYGTPITDFKAYTPTFTGFGTPTSVNFISRRVGDELEVIGTFTTGTTTATEARISLGYGGIDGGVTTVSTLPSVQFVGKAKQNAAYSTTDFQDRNVLAEASKTYVTFSADYSTFSFPLTKGNGNAVAASSTTWSLFFKVPIAGWSSSVQQSDGYEARKLVFEARTNGGSIATSAATYVTLTWTTPTVDHVGGWNGSDTYTIRTADCYDIHVIANQNSAAAAYLDVAYRINGGSEVLIGRTLGAASSGGVATGTATVCLNAGDTVQARAQTEGTQGIGTLRRFTIKRSGGGTPTMSATEVVAAYYTGAPPTGTLSTSFNTTTYGTKVTDTHNAYSGGTYTVPVSGFYNISAGAGYSGTHALNTIVQLSIHVNGTERVTQPVYAGGAVTSIFLTANVQGYPLVAGDLVTIRSYSGATGPSFTSSAPQNWFSISRVK